MAIKAHVVNAEDSKEMKFAMAEMERRIDDKLLTGGFEVKDDGSFELVIEGEIRTGVVRNFLCKKYTDAGWKSCIISGSSEKGERGGLSRVILKK